MRTIAAGLIGLALGLAAALWVLPPRTVEVHSTDRDRVNLTLPDGTSVSAPAGTPIHRKQTRTGGTSNFESSASSASPGLSTSAEGVAGSFKGQAGAAPLAIPKGASIAEGDPGSGGGLTFKAGPTQNMLLVLAGLALILAGPAGFIFGKKFGVGLSLAQAAIVSGAGVLVILLGRMDPEAANSIVLALVGTLVLGAGVYLWTTWRAGSVKKSLDDVDRLAGNMAIAIDEADTGAGTAGAQIKALIKSRFKGDADLETLIDDVKGRYGA